MIIKFCKTTLCFFTLLIWFCNAVSASFEKGLSFSEVIEYVIVNGVFILKNGKTVANVFPGQPGYGKYKK